MATECGRVLRLAHLSQKVDFIELSIRRGHGDFGLAGALRRREPRERQRIYSRVDLYGPLDVEAVWRNQLKLHGNGTNVSLHFSNDGPEFPNEFIESLLPVRWCSYVGLG